MQPHESGAPANGEETPRVQVMVVAGPSHGNSHGNGHATRAADGQAAHDAHASHVPVHYHRGTGYALTALALVVAAGLAIGFWMVNHHRAAVDNALVSSAEAAADAVPTVDVVRVTYSPSGQVVTLPAETRAWYETTIYARVNGYLKKWLVDLGDQIHEGQLLATIETPELDQQLAEAEAKVKADTAQVKLAETNVQFADVTLGRYKDAPKGVVSELERDERNANYQISLARKAAAESDLNSAHAEVDRLRAMLAFKQVTAPFDGTIVDRRVDLGDLVTAGSTSNTTSLFKIAQYDKIRVFVEVPQTLAPQIHDGEEAVAMAREYPGRQFVGQVARTSRSINVAARTLRVEVDVPNPDKTLLPGMHVEVAFHLAHNQKTLQIPASALDFRAGGPQVAVVGKDGRVQFRDVTIARDMGNVVEVSSGVAADEKVALNISNQISNGDLVKEAEAEQPGTPARPPAESGPAQASAADAERIVR